MRSAGIKPILGCEIYICEQDPSIKSKENSDLSHFLLLAKNYNGWKTLIKIISESNSPKYFYKKPRLNLDKLAKMLDGNIIGFCGHLGSTLADKLYMVEDPISIGTEFVAKMKDIFGINNFFLESQLMDKEHTPLQVELTETIRRIAVANGTKVIATPDAHYCENEDAIDQRILLCNNLKVTFSDINKKILNNDSVPMGCFFKSDKYHIPDYTEMNTLHTHDEIENTNFVADMCDDYEIKHNPFLPNFKCPEGYDPDSYLRQLCRNGWREKIKGQVDSEDIYTDRIKTELTVLQGAGLSSYFLIVQDMIDYVKKNNWLAGPGRGCFIPDTNVKMYDGTIKKIYQINIGDIVIDAYGNPQEVYDTLQYDINEDIIELIFENEKTIRCTKDHKFLTKNRGWVEAQYLSDTDDIVEV
jgi:DNA polymerase-3 subunit alpha